MGVTIPFVLEVLCLYIHMIRRGQTVLSESDRDDFRERQF